MRWRAISEELESGRILKFWYQLGDNEAPLRFRDVVDLWAAESSEGREFRRFHWSTLRQIPFGAYKWETPVLDAGRWERHFEFVVLKSLSLDRRQNPQAFQQHFAAADQTELCLELMNLGKTAVMLVPTPREPQANCCHLASFTQTVGEEQNLELWRSVGDAMLRRVSLQPVWLSTAGGGVPWLHVRLDNRPKYYGFQPYRDETY